MGSLRWFLSTKMGSKKNQGNFQFLANLLLLDVFHPESLLLTTRREEKKCKTA